MEKYIESVICEGSIVQKNHMEIDAIGSEKSLSFVFKILVNLLIKFFVSRTKATIYCIINN